MKNNKVASLDYATGRNLYQKMIEEIQDYAVIVLDTNGYIQNWNKGTQKIKGYTRDEVIGKNFSIFYPSDDITDKQPQKLLSGAKHAGRANYEGWQKKKDGSEFWASITIIAIHDDNGKVIGYCEVTRDISGKKATEEELRVSEERYHKMLAEVQDYAIILLSITGVIEDWNAGAERIKGYTSDEILGKNFEIFYTPQDRANGLPAKLLAEAKETGKAAHEGWRVKKDGTKFWGSTTITALHSNEGDVTGFLKVTRDLTQKKIADDKMAAYTAELEKKNDELEQFTYVASHDLQEPLRKIRTFADMIKEHYENSEFAQKYLEKLEDSATRMSELIRSLLDYGRLSEHNNAMQPVDLNTVLSNVRQDYELLIQEKQATIISNNLPVVQGNPMQLGQLFSNLISNSLKFSKDNPAIRINASTVTCHEAGDPPNTPSEICYHLLTFQDNGIGFENQYKNVIFSLFQRLHSKTEYPGTGIGLALCKKIAENHGGFITADSEPGKGAKFSVYLPVK